MNVTVNAIPYDNDAGETDNLCWQLEFKFVSTDKSWTSEYIAVDPGTCPLEKWRALATGKSDAGLTIHAGPWGEDECDIAVEDSNDGKQFVFSAAAGSVHSATRVPFDLVATPLLAALEEAERYGFRFE